jgi:hypothetical protein
MPVPSTAELKTQYLALQQEADFALWRAREANAELRLAYQLALDGQGEAPTVERLAEVRRLEQEAEAKYRELRGFVREHFEQLAVA